MAKARRRRREPTQLDLNMDRVKLMHMRVVMDGEVIGDRMDNNEEAHFIHYWLAVNLNKLEHVLVGRHVDAAMNEGDEDDD